MGLLAGAGGLWGATGHGPAPQRWAGAAGTGHRVAPAGAAAPARFAWAAGSRRILAPTGPPAPPLPGVALPVPPPVTPTPDRPRIAGPTADHRLDRPPSVSAAGIDRVLAEYGSPAAGSGALFYDWGLHYGIDPAYALAFYIQESQAGTQGVARFTHSIGNIRVTPGYASYEGYRSYDSYAAGIADWYGLIRTLYLEGWGLTTPAAITVRYAPWGDGNNPVQYAATVCRLVDRLQP